MNEKGSERIGGAEFILCLAGLHFFFVFGMLKEVLLETVFFSPSHIYLGFGKQSLCLFGLSANQPAVLFSHTKSAPATSYQLVSSTVLS